MNKHILFVMRSLDNPELFTQEQKEANRKSAAAAQAAYTANTAYSAVWAAYFAAADAADTAYDTATECWVNKFFERAGEDRQEYTDEVKRLRAAWHTLAGETPEKDKRMEVTQDNFYRVLAMNDELIHQQKDEISKLKQTINKLRMKGDN